MIFLKVTFKSGMNSQNIQKRVVVKFLINISLLNIFHESLQRHEKDNESFFRSYRPILAYIISLYRFI